MTENQILAEIEEIVGEGASQAGRNDGASKQHDRGRRPPLLLFSALALIAVLVPAGLKASDLLARLSP